MFQQNKLAKEKGPTRPKKLAVAELAKQKTWLLDRI